MSNQKIKVTHEVKVAIEGTPVYFCSCRDGSVNICVPGMGNYGLLRSDVGELISELQSLLESPYEGKPEE